MILSSLNIPTLTGAFREYLISKPKWGSSVGMLYFQIKMHWDIIVLCHPVSLTSRVFDKLPATLPVEWGVGLFSV